MASDTNSTTEETAADLVAALERRRAEALQAGGPDRVARIHESGRLTARERLERLFDPGSWYELGMFAEPELRREGVVTTGDGVITGLARLAGRKVCVIAVETTVLTGTTAPVNMRKQGRIAEWAGRKGLPLVCLSDNDGGRLPDLLGWRFSGVPFDFATFLQSPPGCPDVPRISAVVGPSFGDAALHAAMGNFVVMVERRRRGALGSARDPRRDRRGDLRHRARGSGGGRGAERQRSHGRRR